MEDSDMIDEDTDKITDVQTVEYTGHSPEKPILKDAKTGKFIKGTGSSGKGGRKPGSKDRVSQQMVDIAQSLMERRGAELLEEVADRAPEQALALITKIIPASELQKLFEEDRSGQKSDQPVQINIGVVKGPERLSDSRTTQQISDRQRGLESPVERLERGPAHDKSVISDDPVGTHRAEGEAAKTTSEASIEAADDRAAEAQREQARRYKANTSPSPGYKRGKSSDSTVYLDDPVDDDRDTLRDLYDRGDYI